MTDVTTALETRPLGGAGLAGGRDASLPWCLSDRRVAVAIAATADPDHASRNVAAAHAGPLDAELRDRVADLARQAAS